MEESKGTVFIPKAPREASYMQKAAGKGPAPGEYEAANPVSRKGFTFAGAGRFVMDKGMGPYYEIPSSIGVIQSYHKKS